ncbi:hypothetical protein [Fulvivirga sediminis]|uniref:Uncharacterized protein n=1 Tax=Fulvivirga sediminis TaxID=2803949 RepID=A0A937F9C6_9BACT|nr:hypothetical protein [Fulvivirga sediminis]MBL3656398.1 hypothetical protein [Fulvivirga sediminis]
MRVVGEIPHKDCKITLFHWNGKYIIKIEQGSMEQSFKINELDITGENDLKEIVSEEFIQEVLKNFRSMFQVFSKAISKVL